MSRRLSLEALEDRQMMATLALAASPDVLHTDEASLVSSVGLYSEAFTGDVAGEAAFENTYAPLDFRAPGGGTVAVSGGVVELTGTAAAGTQEVVLGTYSGNLRVSADIGGNTSNPGGFTVGLRIGENSIVIHPGNSPGLLRVDGPGGFGNQATFPTSAGTLHNLTVDVNAATGVFSLTLTDGVDPNNVYSATFTNPNWNGGEIALQRSGLGIFNGEAQVGLFDNAVVSTDTLLVNDGFLPEAFATAVAGESGFESTYAPLDFRAPDGGDVAVNGGVAQLTGPASDTAQEIVLGDYSGSLRVSADIGGATAFPGVFNVGLRIGENNIVFHPGTSTGLLRVEGPGGFGNQNIFPVASSVLHNLTVDVDGATGVFTLTFTDGSNPNNVFSTTFTNPDWTGGEIALRRSGLGIFNGNPQVGLFDNAVVIPDSVVQVVDVSGSAPGTRVATTLGAEVTVNADGTFVYDPTPSATIAALVFGQSLTDTFQYTITDGTSTATAEVSIEVEGLDIVVNNALDFDDFNSSNGVTTLREAIREANNIPGPNLITFDPALVAGGPATISLTLGEASPVGPAGFRISSEIEIVGPEGDNGIIITPSDQQPDMRLFYVSDAGNLTLENLTLTGGRALGVAGIDGEFGGGGGAGFGGAIYNEGRVEIIGGMLTNNSAIGGNGGNAITNEVPAVIAGSGFGGNVHSPHGGGGGFGSGGGGGAGIGGAIYNASGTVVLTDTIVADNVAQAGVGGVNQLALDEGVPDRFFTIGRGGDGVGGGVFNLGGTLIIENSVIDGNLASGTPQVGFTGFAHGGGIYNFDGDVTVVASEVINNSALAPFSRLSRAMNGGGIHHRRGTLLISDSTFRENAAEGFGGGVYQAEGELTISNTEFDANFAIAGGGLSTSLGRLPTPGIVNISSSSFTNNFAIEGGGGIHLHSNGASVVTGTIVSNNSTAVFGGGILTGNPEFGFNTGSVQIVASTISNNSVTGPDALFGGGIVNQSTLEIVDSTVADNIVSSNARGGGIYNRGELFVTGSTVSGNSGRDGGGINNIGQATITNSTISGNTEGGAVFNFNFGGVVVSNSTITNNSGRSGQSGGITNDAELGVGNVTVQNSIVAANTTSGTESNVSAPGGGVSSLGNNLVGQDGNAGGFPVEPSLSDIVLAPENFIDTVLTPLSDSGGPTLTHALVLGSPAIDAGNDAVAPEFDQRGVARVDFPEVVGSGGQSDIGATEAQRGDFRAVTVTGASVDENAGQIDFTVALPEGASLESPISVRFDTFDTGSATAGIDYTPINNHILTFNPGEPLSQTVSVLITNENLVEGDESFGARLSEPVNAFIVGDDATGTIVNDDSAVLRIVNATANEADGALVFVVSLSNPVDVPVSADVTTMDVTATVADGDYLAQVNSRHRDECEAQNPEGPCQDIEFAPGVTEQTFSVTILDDGLVEDDEILVILLENLNAPGRDVTTANGFGTILGDNEVVTQNAAPVGDPQNIVTVEDTSVVISLTGDDGDAGVEQSLSFALLSLPSHGELGSLDASTGQVTYTPDAGYLGPDEFTFVVLDDDSLGAPARISTPTTVSINVAEFSTQVTHTGDSGLGSLRSAIEASNALAGIDTITFDIAGVGPHTIRLLSALPTITDAVIIDGTSEPDFAGTPVVELDGTSAGAGVNGLTINSGGSTVRGLVINRFGGVGIQLSGGDGNIVAGNFIGTDVAGTTDLGNGTHGVSVSNSASNTIGGTTGAARNVISGNDQHGVLIEDGATNNVLQGNFIGTDSAGTTALGNATGVRIANAPSNTIGGLTAGAGNVISGHVNDGVFLSGATATGNLIQGNLIGTDQTGTVDLGNGRRGVHIADGASNMVGGAAAGEGNVISGNDEHSIFIAGSGATNNVVQGNKIGTDAAGTSALANSTGVRISGARNNTIGGSLAGAGNVISSNANQGVFISGTVATGNVVQGNLIGVDQSGSGDLGNGRHGVHLLNAGSTSIGGTAATEGNVISGNAQYGVFIERGSAMNNVVQGNLIGTDGTGTVALPNSGGVRISNSPSNTIGGTAAGAGNVISGNNSDGVFLSGATSNNNVLQGNLIGLDQSGSGDLGNLRHGVFISSAGSNTIGGTAANAGNVISGNHQHGLFITGAGSTNNLVQGNLIGTDSTGTSNLGNTFAGVRIVTASSNTIGGTAADAGNVIAFNVGDGVFITGTSLNNAIQRNSMFSNADLGIDLGVSGFTPNDAPAGNEDIDSGPNNLQNFPEITLAELDGANLTIDYAVPSALIHSAYDLTIEFFLADSANQEGQTFLGSDNYPAGSATLPDQVVLDVTGLGVSVTDQIVATATDDNGNTSEFSVSFVVTAPLLAAGGEQTSQEPEGLRADELQPIVDAALVRLSASGVSAADLATLSSVTFAIADLPGARLGSAGGSTITLDTNAAGYGWYIDPTPLDDSEFLSASSSNRQSEIGNRKSIDLLTVVLHELEHTLGHDHSAAIDDLLNAELPANTRRLPTADLDTFFGNLEVLDEILRGR